MQLNVSKVSPKHTIKFLLRQKLTPEEKITAPQPYCIAILPWAKFGYSAKITSITFQIIINGINNKIALIIENTKESIVKYLYLPA